MCKATPPNIPTRRVVFIGESSVGKTSIINRFTEDAPGSPRPTVGTDYTKCPLTIDGRELMLEIWDTAGAERFRSVGPLYYRSADAAVVVFDLSVRETFEALDFWITAFREHSARSFLVIVGNKCDRPDIQVTISQTDAAGKAYRAPVVWTSALTGDRIESVFELLGRQFVGENCAVREIAEQTPLPAAEDRRGCC